MKDGRPPFWSSSWSDQDSSGGGSRSGGVAGGESVLLGSDLADWWFV